MDSFSTRVGFMKFSTDLLQVQRRKGLVDQGVLLHGPVVRLSSPWVLDLFSHVTKVALIIFTKKRGKGTSINTQVF